MDSPATHMIDIEPASAQSTVTVTTNKSRQKKRSCSKTPKSWEGCRFKSKKLQKMYETEEGIHKYPEGVVNKFFEVMQLLNMANNEPDLYNFRSLRFHQLYGNRKGQYAVWLTGNWRLTMTIEEDAQSRYLLIWEIEDYH